MTGQALKATGDLFEKNGKTRQVGDGDELYSEGSASIEVFFVQQGEITLTRGAGSAHQVVGQKPVGSLVGESAALDEGSRTVSAVAKGPATVLVLPAEVFRKALREDDTLCFEVAVALARTLRSTTESASSEQRIS